VGGYAPAMLRSKPSKPSPSSALSAAVLHGLRSVQTAVNANQTIAEAIDELRSRTIEHPVIYVYALDDDDRLVGQVSMRALLLSSPSARIQDVMTQDTEPVTMHTSFDEALDLFARSKLLALPVVDDDGRLVGAIDVEQYARESLERAEHERVRGVFQTLGLHIEHAAELTSWESYRMRMPWLLCNIAGGMLCALIGSLFTELLQEVVLLAFFLPLVLALSESVSMQSLTLAVGAGAVDGEGRAHRASALRRLRTEAVTAVLLSLTSGVLVACASLLWGGGFDGALTMFLSIAIAMVVAALAGGGVPVVLHALRLDPSVAAGPVTLVIADTSTMLLYLGFGTLILVGST
jgi:magnesium transporter